MSLTHFIQDMGEELRGLLWHDRPSRAALEEWKQLQRRLCRCLVAVARQRSLVQQQQRKFAEKEKWAEWLAARVEVYLHVGDRANAWRHALELDRLRERLQQDRTQLERLQGTLQQQQTHQRRFEQELADLEEEMRWRS
jgi:hypothetical protein